MIPPPRIPYKAVLAGGLFLVLGLVSSLARADSGGVRADFNPPWDVETWKRLGFFTYKPTFVLKDIGKDSNVFYDPDQRQARSDWTATVSPALDAHLTFGSRAALTIHTGADYVWYQTYSNVSHLNLDYGLRGNLNLRALRFFASASLQQAEERPSNEVDTRAKRRNLLQRVGVGYEVSPKSAVDVITSREHIDYSDPDFVQAVLVPPRDAPVSREGDPSPRPLAGPGDTRSSLAEDVTRRGDCPKELGGSAHQCWLYRLGDLLTRTETKTIVQLTHQVFGRTCLVLGAERRDHDFQSKTAPPSTDGNLPPVGSIHDSSEDRITGGFEVDNGGLLSGDLRFGVTSFVPRVLVERKTRTPVGEAVLNWKIGGRAALTTAYDRDLNFSIYGNNLYFIQDHGDVECVFYLNRVLALDGGYGLFRLSYPRIGPEEPRRDEIRKMKGGLRFRVANRTVARLTLEGWTRTSNVPNTDSHQVLVTTGVETTF